MKTKTILSGLLVFLNTLAITLISSELIYSEESQSTDYIESGLDDNGARGIRFCSSDQSAFAYLGFQSTSLNLIQWKPRRVIGLVVGASRLFYYNEETGIKFSEPIVIGTDVFALNEGVIIQTEGGISMLENEAKIGDFCKVDGSILGLAGNREEKKIIVLSKSDGVNKFTSLNVHDGKFDLTSKGEWIEKKWTFNQPMFMTKAGGILVRGKNDSEKINWGWVDCEFNAANLVKVTQIKEGEMKVISSQHRGGTSLFLIKK